MTNEEPNKEMCGLDFVVFTCKNGNRIVLRIRNIKEIHEHSDGFTVWTTDGQPYDCVGKLDEVVDVIWDTYTADNT